MAEIKKESVCDGVNFVSIFDDRFKTNIISATISFPLDKDLASQNAILPFVLRRSCRDFPSFIKMNEKLSSLYGANMRTFVQKIGDNQALTILINGIDDKYSLDNEVVSEEITKLLCAILFRPNLEDNRFRECDVEQEKRQLVELIDSELNDKRTYSRLRCEEIMCNGERYGINCYGKKDDVTKINGDDVFSAWQRFTKNARIDLMMIGNSDYKPAFRVFCEEFSKIKREYLALEETEIIEKAEKTNLYRETMDVVQCKLVLGFRTGSINSNHEADCMNVMSVLFGGTPHSKLFLNVREKMSLCYYCISQYDRNKGIMFVECGVEKGNVDKAKDEILNQLDLIRKGEFDDFEIETTKLSLANALTSLSDSPWHLFEFYTEQMFNSEFMTVNERIKSSASVSREDIIEAAKKVTLDTVYVLENNK